MARRIRPTLGVAAALLAVGCTIPPAPQQRTAAELQALAISKLCQPSLPVFGRFYDSNFGIYLPPNGNILMSQDGGWCQLSNLFVFQDVVTVGTLSLASPPAHGEVRTGIVGQQLRIGYRPSAGFTGTDGFVVHFDAPQPWDIPVRVTVVP